MLKLLLLLSLLSLIFTDDRHVRKNTGINMCLLSALQLQYQITYKNTVQNNKTISSIIKTFIQLLFKK